MKLNYECQIIVVLEPNKCNALDTLDTNPTEKSWKILIKSLE